MAGWNIFRLAADLSHISAKCILLFSIHRNRSAEGVSLIFQVLYAMVFCTRYTDLFRETHAWNYFFKIFYILSSFYTIAIMRFVYPRTREKEVAWKLGALILGGSLVLSPLVMMIFERKMDWSLFIWLWTFSQILESACVLPQLLLLRQTTVPTVITSFYIVFLGSYRGLYILNWIWRELDVNDRPPNTISVIFGIVQTLLYLDFGWVYWTRQRVKLRNGGIIDADDLRRGWLLSRIFSKPVIGRGADDLDADGNDEESAPALGGHSSGDLDRTSRGPRAKWGARGISVSADDGMLDRRPDDDEEEHGIIEASVDPDARMQDPDELARVLDDDEDEDNVLQSVHTNAHGQPSGIRSGDEWRDI